MRLEIKMDVTQIDEIYSLIELKRDLEKMY